MLWAGEGNLRAQMEPSSRIGYPGPGRYLSHPQPALGRSRASRRRCPHCWANVLAAARSVLRNRPGVRDLARQAVHAPKTTILPNSSAFLTQKLPLRPARIEAARSSPWGRLVPRIEAPSSRMQDTADFRDQSFRREPWRFLYGCPHQGANRQDLFMNRHQVDEVAHRSPPNCRHDLVQCKIHGMQYVAEKLVGLGWEESKITVDDPFQSCSLLRAANLGAANSR